MSAKKIVLAALLACGVAAVAQQAYIPPPPEQPLPYSHKTHIAAGLTCKDCHTMPDPGDMMTFPATSKCMACHTTIKKDSPAIQKLADYNSRKEDIPWKRVYKVPDFVWFPHKSHLASGKITCENCHGDVKSKEVMQREKPITMSSCISCHSDNMGPTGCTTCHEQR